ncbi:SLC13 family permease [Propionicimonas sp.]|uniref:SLC13 family permease n=1 Tax=Propionicimonas sp. TaxID=1955623 RepID=UPI0039E6B353
MAGAEVLAALLLAAVLAFAVVRPRGLPEAVAAVPAALVVLLTGGVDLATAGEESLRLLPVVGFLAAVLLLSELCARDGLFDWAGRFMARRSRGEPQRLLVLVFGAAAVTTAVLSLDATVVLLTPVVFATAARVGVRPRPHVYACTHLANAGSLLLPVSNLTNLLAMTALGISFVQFGALMLLPWLVVIGVEYLAFRWYFAGDLSVGAGASASERGEEVALPRFSASVVALTLAGFVVASFVGLEVAWVAGAGALVLAVRALVRRQVRVGEVAGALNIPFLAFVLALGVVVKAVVNNGLADLMGRIVPSGASLPALLGWAGLAAVLANVVNNLPAVLILLPLAVGAGPGPALAVLIGVNVGPNLTYVGSLATLLWRRIVHAHDHEAPLAEFTWLGLLATPVAIVAAVVALWGSLQLFGGAA